MSPPGFDRDHSVLVCLKHDKRQLNTQTDLGSIQRLGKNSFPHRLQELACTLLADDFSEPLTVHTILITVTRIESAEILQHQINGLINVTAAQRPTVVLFS